MRQDAPAKNRRTLEMMRTGVLILVFFILVTVQESAVRGAEPYLWPLPENFGISSTFGEPRANHVHAGIDISTNGETGLPVLAIDDGFVIRLKIQKRAYGRALYIKHQDGTQSVYAHLQSYSADLGLEKLYQDTAAQAGTRYVGDIFIDPPVPVKRGDVVAFSGETGAGLPHLHLEIRKEETTVVNPLLNGFRDVNDPVPPAFQACYFYPLTAGSSVNGSLETHQVKLKKTENGYSADQTPVVRGDFLLSASAYDPALRPYRRTPFSMNYSIDGKAIYSIRFDQFSYDQPPAYGLIYDLGKPGPSYYEYPIILSKLIDTPLPFVARAVPFYTKHLAPGPHRLQIEASDTNNNSSTAFVDFIVNTPPEAQMESVTSDGNDLIVSLVMSDENWTQGFPQRLAGEVEYSTDNGKTFRPFPSVSLDLQATQQEAGLLYRVPLNYFESIQSKKIILKARGFDGVEYSPYVIASVFLQPQPEFQTLPAATSIDFGFIAYGNSVRITLDSVNLLTATPNLQVGSAGSVIPMQRTEPFLFQAVIPVSPGIGPLDIILSPDRKLTVPVDYLGKGNAASIVRDNYELEFGIDSLYWSTFVWTKSLPAYPARYLPIVGSLLQLGPRGLPLKKSATLSFSYPAGMSHPERLTICNWNRSKQKWESIPSEIDRTTLKVKARIDYLDLYALIQDNAVPVITPVFPKRNSKTHNTTPKLAATILDSGTDIDDEKVTFLVDGIAFPAEYDPDRNLAVLQIEKPLKKGYHRFVATAQDYAGNRTQTKTITFRVY